MPQSSDPWLASASGTDAVAWCWESTPALSPGAISVDGSSVGPEELRPGQRVGRYEVASRVGVGGMGVVYAAHNPGLDRRVAVKLLRTPRTSSGESQSGGQRRLVREAQAMARLAHPNVVAVYDVGVHEHRVFVAMEFVEGTTLKAWNQRERTIEEVLEVFIAAAHGLQAAHDVGLVHRDFKPDNVMLASDGKVRVMDFGLARPAGVHSIPVDASTSAAWRAPGDTQTRGRTGTPAYMSPEQHAGLAITPQSDQFSYCIALYESVYGVRPFVGDSVAALAFETLDGNVARAPKSSKVPKWLRSIILRGLAVRPEDRWPSMAALADALQRRTRRRHLRGAALLIAVALTATGWALALAAGLGRPDAGGEPPALHDVGHSAAR